MDVTPLIRSDAKIIQNYKGGVFKISNESFSSAVIVTPTKALQWQAELPVTVESFSFLRDFPDAGILLFGTGGKFVFQPIALRRALKETYGVSFDAMDTGAACRTYNVLMAEGRPVIAALLPF